MDAKDELSELWCGQHCAAVTTKEEIVMLVQKKTTQFDRLIFVRNVMECVAAVAVTVIFAAMAAHAPDALQKTGLSIVATSGIWIIFFLLRYSRASAAANPDQKLSGYRDALVERYDREIRLLRTVKYWYLLPPWIGLLTGSGGVMLAELRKGRLGWYDFIAPAIYTACFALIWWLNECTGYRACAPSELA